MDRRTFIGTLAGGLLATPLVAEGPQAGSVARIGYLAFSPLESPETWVALDAFRKGRREGDYVEGQNIAIEYRSSVFRSRTRYHPDSVDGGIFVTGRLQDPSEGGNELLADRREQSPSDH
jgi:hypothetical protein